MQSNETKKESKSEYRERINKKRKRKEVGKDIEKTNKGMLKKYQKGNVRERTTIEKKKGTIKK
jgi:hypothetical protein